MGDPKLSCCDQMINGSVETNLHEFSLISSLKLHVDVRTLMFLQVEMCFYVRLREIPIMSNSHELK